LKINLGVIRKKMSKLSIFTEFIAFIKENKKWYLYPIIIVLVLFGALIILAEGSTIAPFIYAVF